MARSQGGIHRGSLPSDHYTMIENAWARDEDLSYKARGILTLLLSHEPGWVVRLTDLVTKQDGISSVRAGIKELEARGYLKRTRVRKPDGSWDNDRWDIGSPNHVRYSHVEHALGQGMR